MAQTREVRGVATSIRTDNDGWTHVRYHKTDVVSFNETTVSLRTGGWRTVTTKRRMNQASHQFNLGWQVYQEKGEWYAGVTGNAMRVPFAGAETLTLQRVRVAWDGERWAPCH